MKKAIIILMAAVMLSLSAACGNGGAQSGSTFDEAALQADAEQVVKTLQEGGYEAVAEKFDSKMAASLSVDTLKDGWEQTVTSLGAYVEHVSTAGSQKDGYYTVEMVEKYENNGLLVRVVYDDAGKIAGLRCTYTTVSEPEQSEEYAEEEITVAGDPALPLGGILTLPKGVEKPPVVILIQGSGSSDRNENIYGNMPFADIAHGLAKEGIASIRYDKRYYTYPDSGVALGAALTLDDEVLEDAYAAIALAQQDQRLDGEKVYVLGHSLGGILVPAIAAEHPELAGAISMAGTLRPLWEVTYDQNQEAIAAIDRTQLSDADKETLDAQIAQIDEDIAVLRGGLDGLSGDAVLMGIPVGYWRSLSKYSGANYIEQVSMPMLILQGGADFQVYPDKDYPLWQEALAGRDNVSFHLYEGLNHLMMPTQGKRDISEYQTPGNVDGQVIQDIAAFIKGE